MSLDLVSVAIGFVPGALAAGAYAFTHNSKLASIANDVKSVAAGVSTVSTTAAAAVSSVVNAAKKV
jgi:hypothetical protein